MIVVGPLGPSANCVARPVWLGLPLISQLNDDVPGGDDVTEASVP